ncbi:MAG: nitroreductase family protein [Bryobacteraceae bacterium]
MEFHELIQQRRSVRVFTRQAVEESKLQEILQAANAAPSAGNLQAYEIFVVRDARRRKELAGAALGQEFVAQAPVALVFCAHPALSEERYRDRGRSLYSVQDATIACAFAMLAAADLGLATVWVGAFNDEAVWKAIGSPRGLLPVAILPIGYAGERPGATSRRPLQSLTHEV